MHLLEVPQEGSYGLLKNMKKNKINKKKKTEKKHYTFVDTEIVNFTNTLPKLNSFYIGISCTFFLLLNFPQLNKRNKH